MCEEYTRSQIWFAELLDNAVGNQPAILVGRQTLTYEELLRSVDSTARYLTASGVEPGDRVLLIFPNSAEYIIAVLAVTALGITAVSATPDTGHERLALMVVDATPRLCLASIDGPTPAGVATIRLCLDPSKNTVYLSPARPLASNPNPIAPGRITENTDAFIRYSSGSTGHPKGVVLKHRHQRWLASTLSAVFGLGNHHRELIVAPMAYSGAWQRVAATLLSGGCIVISTGALSVAGILEDIETHSITGFFTPPPLLRMLLKSAPDKVRAALAECNTIEFGSASIAPEELKQFSRLAPNARIFVHYGMTECSRATILDTETFPNKWHTVGRPYPGVELAICDDDGCRLGANQNGQILVRGPQCTDAYWNRPELNRERFNDGWLATGDYGVLDEDGFLIFQGRKDEMICSGGHNFFPAEVEMELGAIEGIEQYLVAGREDPRGILGEVPWAFVVPGDMDTWSPDSFLRLARNRLPSYMVPRWVVTVPQLPLTASGKPDRRRTVSLYAKQTAN